jgi:hypothetical protein
MLPGSVELRLKEGARDPETVQMISRRLQTYPVVEEVRYGREWVEKLYRIRNIAGITGSVLGSVFALVAIIIIGSTIRMAILARAEEIEIMRLVGATNHFVRLPYLIDGTLKGLAGGAIAAALAWTAVQLVSKHLMAAYKQFDEAVVKALWTCLELDDVAVCTHATAVAKTILSLPGQGGLGVQRLDEIALVGPLAKFLSIAKEGHPALDFFLQQFGPRTEVLVERLRPFFQERNPLTVALPGLDEAVTPDDVVQGLDLTAVSPHTRPFSNLLKEMTKLKLEGLDTLLRSSQHTT